MNLPVDRSLIRHRRVLLVSTPHTATRRSPTFCRKDCWRAYLSESLNDKQTQASPYARTDVTHQNRSSAFAWLPVCVGALAAMSGGLLILVLVLELDVERFLEDATPGPYMPDAFDHLNESTLPFVALLTLSLILLFAVIIRKRYSLVLPIFAGPAIGSVGWFVTENFQDPTWFHFVAISNIGMAVSCLVTSVLAILLRRSAEPGVVSKIGAERSND